MAERAPDRDLPVAHALGRILDAIEPVADVETLPLHAACGRILATDVVSRIVVPPCDNAAMDGYALRGADLEPVG